MNENQSLASSTDTAKRPPKRVRWWLIFFIFATPFFLITSAVVLFRIGFTIRENSGRQAMTAEIEKLSSEGYPVDNASIDGLYVSRTSEEHVDQWLNLFDTIDSPQMKQDCKGVPWLDRTLEEELPFREVASKDWKYAEICTALTSKYPEQIAEIHRLVADPMPCQFPIIFQSTETLLPELQSTREVAGLLLVDAHLAVHLRDDQRAMRDIDSLISLSNQADPVPFMIAGLVGIAIRAMALQSLQKCIEVDLLKDDQLRHLDARLKNYCDMGNRWRQTMSDEMGGQLPVFLDPTYAMKSKKQIPPRGHDAVFFIGLMRRAMEIPTEDLNAFYAAAEELDQYREADAKSMLRSLDHLLTHLLAPAFGAMASAWINDVQKHRLARLAIATCLHKHQKQSLPDGPDVLPDIAQLHPFGSEPFGFLKTSDGVVLWGFNLNEDTKQTPPEPPVYDPSLPNTSVNEYWVWKIPN